MQPKNNDVDRFVGGRGQLVYRWLDPSINSLLDFGCDDGNGSFLFSKKANLVWGIDVNEKSINLAKNKFPEINFLVNKSEKLPFDNNYFDAVIMTDVLEHVDSEINAINEIFKVLKSGGQFIITTPHKGLFAFLDPANFKLIFRRKNLPGQRTKHTHYTLKDINLLLKNSAFADNYLIEKVFRSGLLLEPLGIILKVILRKFIGKKNAEKVLTPIFWLSSLEYWIPFGPLSYNIALSIRKR